MLSLHSRFAQAAIALVGIGYALLSIATPARADDVTAATTAGSPGNVGTLDAIVVIAQHLDEARNTIQTQTGASTYVIDSSAIAATG